MFIYHLHAGMNAIVACFRKHEFLCNILPLIPAVIVHGMILQFNFFSDDYLYFYQMANTGFLEFLITPYGGHMLPFRNILFFLLYKAFSLKPTWYFALILMTHLLNVLLLCRVIRLFTGRSGLALFCSALWGINPIHQGVLGFFSAYGIMLVVLFLLLILNDIGMIKCGQARPDLFMVIRWNIFLIAASISYSTGIALAMGFWLISWFFLSDDKNRRIVALGLTPLMAAVPLIYFGLGYVYSNVSNKHPDFSRALTYLLHFWFKDITMCAVLTGIGISSAVAAPFQSFFSDYMIPVSDALSIMAMLCFILTFTRASREVRFRMLAIGFIIILPYGIISAGRTMSIGVFETTLAELVSTPRFHYLSTMACVILFGVMYDSLFPRTAKQARRALFLSVIVLMGLTVASEYSARFIYRTTYGDWGERSKIEIDSIVRAIRKEIDESPSGGSVYFRNESTESIRMIVGSYGKFPGLAAIFVLGFPDDEIDGKRVFFVEKNRAILNELTNRIGTRISRILVAEETAIGRQVKQLR
jgi:hypothetical protein